MESIETALGANGLVAAVVPADANPAMPNPAPGMTHWLVSVEGGVVPYSFRVSILREEDDPSPPSPAEAFGLLAADLRHSGLDMDQGEWLAARVPEGGDEAAWLDARRHLLDALDDLQALPRDLQALILDGPAPAPSPAA